MHLSSLNYAEFGEWAVRFFAHNPLRVTKCEGESDQLKP